ncbi:hypothetical protein KUTeg_005632 [Tegillarca granosa]|uniref:Cilia- and flagella-associated protein 99 n=1 Tax=Tegillarca granosa TaxID=220873 RepID=A0ABQ9FPU4_TEGGR|nr:hypothetical protein KUTeg_005632 [Tegillarca granosa]
MALNHGQLVRHCVHVLDTFDREMQSVENHINKYLKQQMIDDESDQTFIIEVFSNCIRYSSIMQVVMDGFFAKDGRNTLRSEQNLYIVICYLAVFRLDELGMIHFKKFVSSQDVNRMYRFLNFFLNEKNLITWIKDGWEKFYEHEFVQISLISTLQSWMPELQQMLSQMKNKIDNKLKTKKNESTKATEIKAFNLTQPRPRSIPIPEPIPKLEKHKPVPSTTYKHPVELDSIKDNKEANRRRAEERLMEASKLQFACCNPEKSRKTVERMNDIIFEEDRKLEFDRHKANPAPAFLSQEVPIKLNTAAILREGKLYQKREDDMIKKFAALEAGAKDTSDFDKWQSEMKRKDLDAQLFEIERRRLAGKLSHEEAILARQELVTDNKQKVQAMKEETQKMFQEYLQQKLREEQEIRQLVEDTMQGHKNAKDATKKIQEYKRKIVQEVNEESRELMRIAFEEAEAEMKKKMELIHQIRAMEAVPIIRQKFVDLTATSGHGLLGEMSIAELKERLCLMKTAEKENEENKRDEILQSKQEKDQKLLDTLETISRHRLEQTKSAAVKLEEKKRSATQRKPEYQDDRLLEMQRKLDERKAQRRKEQEKSKITSNQMSTDRTRSLINQKP